MTKIQIKSISGYILFEYDEPNNTFRKTLEKAVSDGADLEGVNLRGANLAGAYLVGAYLRGANLGDANLRHADLRNVNLRDAYLEDAYLKGANIGDADLRDADLEGAYLRGADLRDANLGDANLERANLRHADLRDVNLRHAYLAGAKLEGANLTGADLRDAKNIPKSYVNLCTQQMLFIFTSLKQELPKLRQKLVEGKIEGTQYEGDCCCLIGTLGNGNDDFISNVVTVLKYYDKGLNNPAEQWFYQIRKGDTPENNFFAKHALKLIDEVLEK